MAAPLLFEVQDGRGKMVKVLEPTWNHVLRNHREFEGAEDVVMVTINDPDMVIRPENRPKGRGIDRRMNCRLGAHPGYKALWVVVPIDYQGDESWMVTAYLTFSVPKGDLIFVRVPFRWS